MRSRVALVFPVLLMILIGSAATLHAQETIIHQGGGDVGHAPARATGAQAPLAAEGDQDTQAFVRQLNRVITEAAAYKVRKRSPTRARRRRYRPSRVIFGIPRRGSVQVAQSQNDAGSA